MIIKLRLKSNDVIQKSFHFPININRTFESLRKKDFRSFLLFFSFFFLYSLSIVLNDHQLRVLALFEMNEKRNILIRSLENV